MQKSYLTSSSEETERIGELISNFLCKVSPDGAIIAMRGEMGVGKTAFTRGFCRPLGITGVRSPTYTVVNAYRSPMHNVYHFDMYRIEGEEDLYSIGFDDYVRERGAYLLIEWSERIAQCLPRECFEVEILRTDGNTGRKILFTYPDSIQEDSHEALSL